MGMSKAMRGKASGTIVGLVILLLSNAWASGPVAAQLAEFHVSPQGNNDNPGTVGEPFATLERARDLVRQTGLAGETTCTVWLHGGIHRRDQVGDPGLHGGRAQGRRGDHEAGFPRERHDPRAPGG